MKRILLPLFIFQLLFHSVLAQSSKELLRKADEQFENLHYDKALPLYERAFQNKEENQALRGIIRSHLELGMQKQLNGDATGSQAQLAMGLKRAEELVQRNASNEENRLLRGLLYVYNAQYEKARADFEYVKGINPDNGRVYYYLWLLEPVQGLARINHAYVSKALRLDPGLFELYQELGSYYAAEGMATEAISSFEKAIEISPKNYKAHFALGQVYWSMGDLEKMRYHFEQSLLYFPDFGYGQMLLGGVELMSGNTTEAVSWIKKALANNPQAEDYLPMYKQNYPVLNNYNFKVEKDSGKGPLDENGYPRYYQEALGLAQGYDYPTAINKFQQCYDLYQDYDQKQVQWSISILSWISHCYLEMGEYAHAIHSSKDALQLAIKENITTDQASLAAGIGMIYYYWGDLPNAIDFTHQSLEYLQKYNQNEQLYDANINLAGYYRKWENYDSAIYHNQKAVEFAMSREKLAQVLALKELALSQSKAGLNAEARISVEKMLSLAENTDMKNQASAMQLGAAQVYYRLGEYEKAKKYLLQAKKHFVEFQSVFSYHPTLIDFSFTYSGINSVLGQVDLSYHNLQYLNKNLIDQISTQFPAMNEQGKLLFYRQASHYFEIFNSFAFTHTNVNQLVLNRLYENQLLKKGLLFNDAAKFHQMMSNSDNELVVQLYDKIERDRNLIARSMSYSNEEQEKRGVDIKVLQNEVDSLQVEISRITNVNQESPIYERNLVKKVKKTLQPDEAAIEMIRFRAFDFHKGGHFTDQVYYLALIQKGNTDSIEYVLLRDGNFMENKGYQAYFNAIEYELEDEKSYDIYWAPVQEKLDGIKRVYFAGDGVYHKLNLNTLYDARDGSYVIEKMDLRLLTSTRDLIKKTPKFPKEGKIFLIGSPSFDLQNESTGGQAVETFETRAFTNIEFLSPLPGTYEEVKSIERLLGGKWETEVLTGSEAMEGEVKRIQSPTVLHIATHGYFQQPEKNQNPLLYSGLFLSGAVNTFRDKHYQGEDGILTAYEAMNMDLFDTQMVVMSACETGMGQIENGEGVYGLQRAFLIAGSQSVVMSMWKVNDQTTMELMSDFYARLRDSNDKHQAFREAQLQLKKIHPSPKYWGAFNIVGK
ncbi:CHAT domain-containing protein [Reichenbachiella ulvae]|uniref:CHAT domain-containing protein n=1 Tax=Reichenbachiella ulvae TaxID=2980104 RepID=A0ABT3CNJ6_9BACT|nr:CHAT domain-containing protein [Reichenbachiella ulvae]MCV9385316.1 CHAT domain-containing protein [Reichenbachiella ulvae]